MDTHIYWRIGQQANTAAQPEGLHAILATVSIQRVEGLIETAKKAPSHTRQLTR